MDAIATVDENRATNGHGRYSLYTGDIGVAMLLQAVLDGDAGFPFLERRGRLSRARLWQCWVISLDDIPGADIVLRHVG